jgi:multidrug efflux system membrane fusion protein
MANGRAGAMFCPEAFMSSTVAPSSASPVVPRRSRAGRVVWLLVVVALLLGAVAWFVRAKRSAPASAPDPKSAALARVVSVITAKVTREDVPVWLEGIGNVSAFFRVTVKPQVDGRLDKVFFKEGQAVKKGDLLAQIDPRPFTIQLESAAAALARDQANLKNALLNVDRYQKLAQDNLITGQQLTDQQSVAAQLDAQIKGDQAQIDAARLNLDYARIRSPIDGVAGVRQVDPGNVVHAADPNGLVVVTQIDPIAVFFTLPEDQLLSVREAMGEQPLVVEALSRDGDRTLGQGELSVIDNEINQATATVRLKAIFQNPDHRLWPNQFVKARVKLKTRVGALVVPAAVVQHGPQGTFAYVVGADSTAAVRPIRVVSVEGERAIIGGGLAPDEVVVVSGQAQLRPGARVSASKPAASASAAPAPGAATGAPPTDSAGGSVAAPAGSVHRRGAAPAGSAR